MKKLLLSAVIAGFLGTGSAFAAAPNAYQEGLLIPYVVYDTSTGDLSTAAIISRFDGNLHWAFYDGNGNRLAFGQKAVEANDRTPFNWQAEAMASGVSGLDGEEGYLLFVLDTNKDGQMTAADSNTSISGNSFLVNLTDKDAAFIPTFGVDRSFLSSPDISSWTNNPITDFNSPIQQAVDAGNTVHAEYLIDGTVGSGDGTRLVFWTTDEPASTYDVTLHDGEGTSKTITLQLLNDNLNVIDLEAVSGVSSGFFGDGFIHMTVPAGVTAMGGFTMINSDFVGALQTTMFNVID
jgi:hypothetical protein